jgi:nucleotide-binding universal stress UspA family protein
MLAIRKILHPTDFSAASASAFRVACSLARDYGARLCVLHVDVPPLVPVSDGIGIAQAVVSRDLKPLREQLSQLKAPDPKVQLDHQLLEGDPAAEILRFAAESKTDVIIMGTHGRTGLGRLLMGSVAEQVVRRATCAVVTIKMPLTKSPADAGDSP